MRTRARLRVVLHRRGHELRGGAALDAPIEETGARALPPVGQRVAEWKRNHVDEEAAQAQARKDHAAGEQLRELRAQTAGEYDPGDIDADYAAALRDYGIDVKDPALKLPIVGRIGFGQT